MSKIRNQKTFSQSHLANYETVKISKIENIENIENSLHTQYNEQSVMINGYHVVVERYTTKMSEIVKKISKIPDRLSV